MLTSLRELAQSMARNKSMSISLVVTMTVSLLLASLDLARLPDVTALQARQFLTRTSSLADVRRMWGPDVQIAIIAAPGEDGSLEAFVDPAPAGFVTGKLVVTAQLSPGALKAMRERALKTEFMDSSTRKHTLQPEDEALALAAPIVSLSFIPQARLDAEAIVARFGTPARRIRSNGHLEHFLYPDKGLDVVLDSEGLAAEHCLMIGDRMHDLLGASRKRFIAGIDPSADEASDRLGGSIAAHLVGAQAGVAAVRVHDVRETVQALEVLSAVRSVAPTT